MLAAEDHTRAPLRYTHWLLALSLGARSERGIQFVEAGLLPGFRKPPREGRRHGLPVQVRQALAARRRAAGRAERHLQRRQSIHRPLPIATYDLGKVKLNAAFAPHYGAYNPFATFGFYFSLPLTR